MSCRLRGIGSFLPPRVVTNAEVGALSGIAPERIASLFDVEERISAADNHRPLLAGRTDGRADDVLRRHRGMRLPTGDGLELGLGRAR